MAQDTDSAPACGTHQPCAGKACLVGLPNELLRMVAADPDLTNHDRKQARLACRVLEGAMRPCIFRRAFISRVRTDRDIFLSIAAAPHIAACVEEVVWLELGCHGNSRDFSRLPCDLMGFIDVQALALETASDLFWLPKSGEVEAKEFLAQFKDAIACMPKARSFSSQPMRSDRVLWSHPQGYDCDVSSIADRGPWFALAWTQGFMSFLLPTMRKFPGQITRLRFSAGSFGIGFGQSLVKSHIPSIFKHLTSIDLTYSFEEWEDLPNRDSDAFGFLRPLQHALFAASDLQELSIAIDYGPSDYGHPFPLPIWMFRDEDGRPHKWKRLRSLRLVHLMRTEVWLGPLIAAHADTLRYLDLDHCNLYESFALQVASMGRRGKAPRLHSITINEPGVEESALISEQKLLGFFRHGFIDMAREWEGKTSEDVPSPSDAREAGEDQVPDSEHHTGAQRDLLFEEGSDYDSDFEFTGDAEEDYNSDEENYFTDEESPPWFRHMKWDEWGEAEQIGRGRFVTHSSRCKRFLESDSDDADDDQVSDHSSEW